MQRTVSARSDFVLPVEDAAKGMALERVDLDPREVVFFKGIVEASDGLATIFAQSGGSLTVAAPISQAAALAELLGDVESECAGMRWYRGEGRRDPGAQP